MTNWMTFFKCAALATLLAGCAVPLKPGWGIFRSDSGVAGAMQQSQNPKSDSTQRYKRETTSPDGTKTIEEVETKIGAAQKDFAREAAAKLTSLRPVMYVGIIVFLFGAASLFWPPLKAIVGSMTTSLVAIAAGIALIVLPSLVAGNEILILCIGVGAVGLYWFSHRHGELRGKVRNLEGE